ncbi:extracellular protein [Lactiplantibacillus plantarum]|nr:extracellular protein [Lactiplantibacillus plantarum]
MKKINKLMILGMLVFGVTGATMINPEMTTAAHASANITIDGKMNDWKDATLTEGYNGYTALASAGQYVNVYVKMKNGAVPGYGDYNFTIDGKTYYIWSKNLFKIFLRVISRKRE